MICTSLHGTLSLWRISKLRELQHCRRNGSGARGSISLVEGGRCDVNAHPFSRPDTLPLSESGSRWLNMGKDIHIQATGGQSAFPRPPDSHAVGGWEYITSISGCAQPNRWVHSPDISGEQEHCVADFEFWGKVLQIFFMISTFST